MKIWFYKHYKWGLYEVIWVAKHSETLENLVVYKTLYNNDVSDLWVRPKSMFEEKINIKGELILRFKYIWNENYKTS
jgi:hypothetical protein